VFGRKDFQQLVLIRRMVDDLDLHVHIVAAPTVREPDGLAMSSRNRYLSAEERGRALAISAALRDCQRLFAEDERDPAAFTRRLYSIDAPELAVEYAEIVDPESLQPVERAEDGSVCAVAARVGATRLIDNVVLGEEPEGIHALLKPEAVATTNRPLSCGR
ncbi:MAG TPA: pantoate--beta-alanine ligase, partial [Longimicrobiaceae bacterium]|nr:pantoate--beta-alanine ligase [Longimicrobiaceae bacterium]